MSEQARSPVDILLPAFCTRCQHPSHAGQTCTVAFALRNVYGTPKLPCIRCGPGTQEEGDDDDRA